MSLAAASLIPLIVALAGAAVLGRVNPARASLWCGVSFALAFLIGWQILVGPAWLPRTAYDRIGHLVLGAALFGAAIDALGDRPALRYGVSSIYILASAWISAAGGLMARAMPPLAVLASAAILALAWLAAVSRLSGLRAQGTTFFTILLALSVGLLTVAAIDGDAVVAKAALAIVSGLVGLAIWHAFSGAAIPMMVILVATAAIFGGVWAMAQRAPYLAPGLAVLFFILFADHTARRVPMPAGRVRGFLSVLALAGVCAIPLILSAIIVAASVAP
jgi:hypothetical protein